MTILRACFVGLLTMATGTGFWLLFAGSWPIPFRLIVWFLAGFLGSLLPPYWWRKESYRHKDGL